MGVLMERPITDLKGKHIGSDIYVIASGPSAGYIERSFFDNKIAIGVNETYKRFPNQSYIIRKDYVGAVEAYAAGIPLIMSRYDCGSHKKRTIFPKLEGEREYYVFLHSHNMRKEIDLDVIGTDKLVVSYSTITSAMHLAAYMGADNIILLGHDCGKIDGQISMKEYHKPTMNSAKYDRFLSEIEPQTLAVRDRLREVYGCNVYSLNPWVNLGIEGHEYKRITVKPSRLSWAGSATSDVIEHAKSRGIYDN